MKIDLIFFDAGGGHRAAATALKLSIEQQKLPWDVRLVNLQEVLSGIDIFRQVFKLRMEDVYNLLLRKGWTWGSPGLLKAMHGLIWLYHPLQVHLLKKHWRRDTPDVVLSVVPNFNRSMHQAIQAVRPGTPYVIVITDIADYPPHFWLENQLQTVFCGSARAAEQARAISAPGSTVIQTSGMVIHPRFYEPVTVDRRAERLRLGLEPDLPTGLLLFGGYGSSAMPKIVERLSGLAGRLQLIAICGRNEKLKRQLEKLQTPVKMFVEGFTSAVPAYMHTSDFMIGKPGPGSISEALAMKLPVIVECNSWTLPQERYNAEWVREQGVGVVVNDFRNVAQGVAELLEPANFARFRAAAAAIENRAVFEIPGRLAEILASRPR